MNNYMRNLVYLRKKNGYTQGQIASKLGISQQQWSDYERERNEIPMRYFIQVCKILNASADQILELNEDPQTPAC